jgi:hypothetical protein
MSCFQGLLFCPEAASLLLHNFCIYHISPPGHEVSGIFAVMVECIFLPTNDSWAVFNQHYLMTAWFIILCKIIQLGAAPILASTPVASANDLADQVADILDFFG